MIVEVIVVVVLALRTEVIVVIKVEVVVLVMEVCHEVTIRAMFEEIFYSLFRCE